MRQVDLLDLPISQRTFESTMQMIAGKLGGRFEEDVIPLPVPLRSDSSYPRGLRVLYRKLPCGFFDEEELGPCVSFDVIPVGIKGDPRRLRSYRSFAGNADDSVELFQQLTRFLRAIVSAVSQHQRV